MSGDVLSLATEMTPYVSAAAAAYGGAVRRGHVMRLPT